MVGDRSNPAVGATMVAAATAELLDLVYRVALECTRHPQERVRVSAAGTLAAAAWTFGAADAAPVSGRGIQRPSPDEVRAEYAVAVLLRLDAETALDYAHDTGLVDWLALVAGIGEPGQDPWWQPVLDAVAAQDGAAPARR